MTRRGAVAGLAVTAATAVAVLLGGCGSSSSSSKSVATVPSSTITRAAYVSSAASGYRMVLVVNETVGTQRILTTGSGSFSVTKHAGSMTVRTSLPAGLGAPTGGLREDVVISGGTVYIKLPPFLTSRLPGAKPWLKLNLAELGQKTGLPGLSSLTGGSASTTNPGQFLDYLRATSSGSVQNLGQATINGIKTTHYHGEIDLAKLPNAVPSGMRKGVKQFVASLEKKFKTGNLPVDAWVDSSHLVRRIAMDFTEQLPSVGKQIKVAMQIDFISYGPQPTPAVPPASQTSDLFKLFGGALSSTAGA
jgi:hypothetical protein